MRSYLSKQADQIVGANMHVTMGSLKSMQVFVLGEVRMPGSYALGSFSTITNALLAAGGPSSIGSLRNVQLKRRNKTVVEMDFYDFLLNGDKSSDSILQSGDVVFVPTTGPLVGVAGNVRRPAIYELKDEKDLLSLFEMAGGVIPTAFTQQIQVERIKKNERQIVIDIDDKNLTRSKDFNLQDGDLVKVFSIVDRDANVLHLAGNVKRPGKYEFKPGMRVQDLVRGTSDLLSNTYYEYALIKRLRPPGLQTELVPFHLGKVLFDHDDTQNVRLQSQDSVYIFSKSFFRDTPTVTVSGEVRKGERFDLADNTTVKDIILQAGGLTKDAFLEKGEIIRVNDKREYTTVYFDVAKALAGDPGANLLLQDEDEVRVHSVWEVTRKRTVSIDGEVTKPGTYKLTQNMTVKNLVFAAGNILESAYHDEAEVSSSIIENGRSVRIDYQKINLGLALDGDPAHNIVLQPSDRIFVKKIPDWKEEQFASVGGEIRFPGRYIIKKGETLSSLIERAGAYTDEAYLRGAVFTRNSVRELQQKSIDDMILRLESRLLVEGSLTVSAAASKEEIESKKVEIEQKKKFIESLKKLKATGRMTIRLTHLRLLKGSDFDIELEDGDSLHIPMKNSVINVAGAVMSKGSYIYSGKLNYKNYIEMAGGFTEFADKDNTYVLKVDGSARKLASGFFNWNNSNDRWEMAAFGDNVKGLEPGDTIVVPEKLERIAWMREIKDITQILYQIAVTAGVLIVAF
jgi:protein involved in polysaccharide export with SLBB domain